MTIEFEAKVLDVSVEETTQRILAAGGVQTTPRRLQRRWVYDVQPYRPSRFMRLRHDGFNATLTVKDIASDAIDGTLEEETGVNDLEATRRILEMIGYVAKAYQENRRTSFELDGVQLEIDEWPKIPPYLEIEANSEDAVLAAAAKLGIEIYELTSENTTKVYRRYGLEISDFPELTFD